jgi:hypothetical protein
MNWKKWRDISYRNETLNENKIRMWVLSNDLKKMFNFFWDIFDSYKNHVGAAVKRKPEINFWEHIFKKSALSLCRPSVCLSVCRLSPSYQPL